MLVENARRCGKFAAREPARHPRAIREGAKGPRPTARRWWSCAPEKSWPAGGQNRGAAEQAVRLVRRPPETVYYKSVKATPKVDLRSAKPIKARIEKEPSFRLPHSGLALGIQQEHGSRIFQIKAGRSASGRSACGRESRSCPQRHLAQRALVYRPLPGLGRARWLAYACLGDRLPHP